MYHVLNYSYPHLFCYLFTHSQIIKLIVSVALPVFLSVYVQYIYQLHIRTFVSVNNNVNISLRIVSYQYFFKVRKRANTRNRYNQAPYLTQNTNGKVTTSQLDITHESLEARPFPAGDHNAPINRSRRKYNNNQDRNNTMIHNGTVIKTISLKDSNRFKSYTQYEQ